MRYFVLSFFLGVVSVSSALANDDDWLSALRGNDIRKALTFIDSVADVDLAPEDGRTALMLCAKRGMTDAVRKLIARGASATARNHNGGTPVMYGAINGSVAIAEMLHDAGADLNVLGSNGWGALMVASAKGHKELVRWLIEKGADINAVDVYGWTPLSRASFESREDVVRVLLDAAGININARDDQGATALHHAATHGKIEIVKMLLRADARKNIQDFAELTAADRARQGSFDGVVRLLSGSGDQGD